MITAQKDAPPPDLRIIPLANIYAHEERDPQRSEPLIEALSEATVLTNPPIVAPMGNDDYVVMDGANRTYCFRSLGYEHLLVQVAPYDSGYVNLSVWQHIINGWDESAFKEALYELPDITIKQGWDHTAVTQILLHDGTVLSIHGANETLHERNRTLRSIVDVYRKRAKVSRTAITDPTIIWPLYPDAVAVVLFPPYSADEIMASAREKAFLPPGISRHIVSGRALRLGYPLEYLQDTETSLEAKNHHLQEWIREKLANRSVRYYAESTYQFDE